MDRRRFLRYAASAGMGLPEGPGSASRGRPAGLRRGLDGGRGDAEVPERRRDADPVSRIDIAGRLVGQTEGTPRGAGTPRPRG